MYWTMLLKTLIYSQKLVDKFCYFLVHNQVGRSAQFLMNSRTTINGMFALIEWNIHGQDKTSDDLKETYQIAILAKEKFFPIEAI